MSSPFATAPHPAPGAITAGPDARPRSLYVHVPFCVRRCSYCDFAVQATREAPTDAWLDAVAAEMRMLSAERGWEAPLRLDTVYLGGGTPSLLRPDAMAELRRRLEPYAAWDDAAEWTCEANPESFGRRRHALRGEGVKASRWASRPSTRRSTLDGAEHGVEGTTARGSRAPRGRQRQRD